ncbi:hypothetical protein [Serratia ficaria]|uniref:hypothetical protein n=1 Tax=Serratia ficaria TaxID=61651 RepID=UPI0021BD4E8D|nr:hypothetical protein [Serratia ficaria]
MMYFKYILLASVALVNTLVFAAVLLSGRSRSQNMKKPHRRHEEKSVAERDELSDQSLVESYANRLRKNLCQDLSSVGENSLHCGPEPKRVVIW